MKVIPGGGGGIPTTTDSSGNPAVPTVSPDGLGSNIAGEDHERYVLRTEDQGVYTPVSSAAAATITSTPGKRIKGLICVVANTGGIVIYDNTAASGTPIYAADSLTAGQVVKFPIAVPCTIGIHVVLTTDGIVNILWE